MESFSKKFKYSFSYDMIFPLFQLLKTAQWYFNGKKNSTPHLIKQLTIKEYAKKYTPFIFIETGTYLGMMINAVKNNFKRIYTIELDKSLFSRAKQKFAGFKHIEVINGDSSKVLPDLLKKINKSSLFWLDAHYSKGITAKGAKDTPVAQELALILKHKIKSHVILIDDADSFNGKKGYPCLNSLRKYISGFPHLKLEAKNNIIMITPLHAARRDDRKHFLAKNLH